LVCLSVFVSHAIPAFPGAEGWGADSIKGGRGGKVYLVTNTAASGPGSFYAAMMAAEPRIVVFRVSGVITTQEINYDYSAGASRSHVTVAGQTSPGGVTLTTTGGASILWGYQTTFHNAIFRFLRCRSANAGDVTEFNGARYFIFDHVDYSGGTDECFSLTSCHHFIIQWCCIANGNTGGQNYGSLFAYLPTTRITMHHNVWAHFNVRYPAMHWGNETRGDGTAFDRGLIDYRNNVGYNYLGWALDMGWAPSGGVDVNFVGNTFKEGPNTSGTATHTTDANAYDLDNRVLRRDGSLSSSSFLPWSLSKVSTPFPTPAVTTQARTAAYDLVLNKVGAFPRDSMNARTIREIRNGTGSWGKLNDPLITGGPAAPSDADNDGMPDFWEDGMGFNKSLASDNNGDHDGDGYRNIEEYINDLALARLCEDYYNPVYPIPSDWPDYNPSCAKSLAVEKGRALVTDADALLVRPNPFSGRGVLQVELRVSAGSGIGGVVRLVDIRGHVVEEAAAQGRMVLGAKGKNLGAGVYFVQWMNDSRALAVRRLNSTMRTLTQRVVVAR
jgi:hypothetical protein